MTGGAQAADGRGVVWRAIPGFKVRRGAILAFAINYAFSSVAFALPQGAVVTSGQVGITQPTSGTMNITASNRSVINWNQFSVGAGELVRFFQPSASSTVLNRVVGQDMSVIYGTLRSNGRVFLINPNGIIFGAGRWWIRRGWSLPRCR